MEKCHIYAEGGARELDFLGEKNVICSLKASECPYYKGITIHYEGDPVTVCGSKGLVEKVELEKVRVI